MKGSSCRRVRCRSDHHNRVSPRHRLQMYFARHERLVCKWSVRDIESSTGGGQNLHLAHGRTQRGTSAYNPPVNISGEMLVKRREKNWYSSPSILAAGMWLSGLVNHKSLCVNDRGCELYEVPSQLRVESGDIYVETRRLSRCGMQARVEPFWKSRFGRAEAPSLRRRRAGLCRIAESMTCT